MPNGEARQAVAELKTLTELNMTSAARRQHRRVLRSGRYLTAGLAALEGLLTLGLLSFAATVRSESATDATPSTNQAKEGEPRRVIPVTISKGETYTISGLQKGAETESKTVQNPNALSIQPQSSGDIVLLGTEGGSWKINATLADGEKVTYAVTVKAEAPPIDSLTPGTAPTAIAP